MLVDHDIFAGANCRGASWWPWPGKVRPDDETWKLAIDCCQRCACRIDCARLALAHRPRPDEGVWAGVLLGEHGRGVAALRAIAGVAPEPRPVQLRLPLG
jgi:hypothetical protein